MTDTQSALAYRADTAPDAPTARLRFLAAASEQLALSLEYEQTLHNVARLAVPGYADWCAVDLLENDGLRRLAAEHADPARTAFVQALHERYPPDPSAGHGAAAVVRTGRSELLEVIDPAVLRAAAVDQEHYDLLRVLGLHSSVTVPLRLGGDVIGALTFVQAESGRRFDGDDLAVLEDLGRRAAVAIHNARLLTELSGVRFRLEQQASELEMQTVELEETMAELELRNEELRVAAEEASRARDEAQRANEAKSQFLAGMSHELRTPLNAIAGYSELLELGIPGSMNAEQQEIVARIQRNQRRLLGLINDILNFTRLTTTRLECPVAPVQMQPLLDGLEQLIGPQVLRKHLDLVQLPVDPDICAMANSERLEQVLLNLLSNAMKFTAPGGRIHVTCEADDACVRIVVEDTGRGIPPAEQVTIFEPFVQVDPEPARENAGVGLGLAISRELVRAMHGEIEVKSEPGKGSRFTVCLPRA